MNCRNLHGDNLIRFYFIYYFFFPSKNVLDLKAKNPTFTDHDHRIFFMFGKIWSSEPMTDPTLQLLNQT
jgi:hypothetical protein